MSSKQAITINLDHLEQLMREYVAEECAGDSNLLRQMQLGHLLLWLTKRQAAMTTNDEGDSDGQTTRTRSDNDPAAV